MGKGYGDVSRGKKNKPPPEDNKQKSRMEPAAKTLSKIGDKQQWGENASGRPAFQTAEFGSKKETSDSEPKEETPARQREGGREKRTEHGGGQCG